MSLFMLSLACLASRLYDVQAGNTGKKRNLSEMKKNGTKTRDKEKNKTALFGSLKSGITGSYSSPVSIGVDNPSPAAV